MPSDERYILAVLEKHLIEELWTHEDDGNLKLNMEKLDLLIQIGQLRVQSALDQSLEETWDSWF